MKDIKKVFTLTSIYASAIVVTNGEVKVNDLSAVETFEKVNDKNAIKIVKEHFYNVVGDVEKVEAMNIVIREIKRKDLQYIVKAEDFMRNAFVVTEVTTDEQ